MASSLYGTFLLKGYDASTKINLASGGDTIKIALVTSTYTPNFDTHEFFDDITNEVVGAGYTAGGATLSTQTYTHDTTDDESVFDGADTTWAASTLTARGAIVYKSTGTDSTSPLIGFIDFATDRISDGGTFQITWAAEGIFNINY